MLSDKEAVQKTLDFLKSEFIKRGRIGVFFDLKELPFINDYNQMEVVQEAMILRLQLTDSGLFCELGNGDKNHYRLTKEGRNVKDFFDWNYEKYLESQKITEHLLKRSYNINVILGCLIGAQFVLSFCQFLYTVNTENKESNIEKRLYKIEESLKSKQKQDFCHSCENR